MSTKRGRIYRRLAWHADGVRILTGTPVPNHYGSLWGQMVGLDQTEWFGSYEAFAQRYLIRDSMFPSIIHGYQNEKELYAKIRRFATIVRREDVFGPDTWQEVRRAVRLPAKAAKTYYKLAKEWFIDEPVTLDVTHTLARMTRLHQLTSGFLPDLEGGGAPSGDSPRQARRDSGRPRTDCRRRREGGHLPPLHRRGRRHR